MHLRAVSSCPAHDRSDLLPVVTMYLIKFHQILRVMLCPLSSIARFYDRGIGRDDSVSCYSKVEVFIMTIRLCTLTKNKTNLF